MLTRLFGVCITAALLAGPVHADSFDKSIEDALKGDWGQIKFNINWRYENVDQEGKGVANGDPIRLRLGYLTPEFYGFQAYGEFEGNTPVFAHQYNSLVNGKTQYPVIADPQAAEINQGWLSYAGIPDTVARVGRQRIKYDNVRWIGNVVWRQMEQTFDSVSLVNKTIGNSELQGAYIWNVRNILAKDVNMSSGIFNLSYKWPEYGKLTTYAYLLDYNGSDAAARRSSTQSYGIRFTGKTGVVDNLKALYTAEYAYQRDFKTNPARYDANYMHFVGGLMIPEVGWGFTELTGKVGWEQLGSDNNVGLQTPLGTNHKFNGWADKFLVTPGQGLQDLYGVVGTRFFGVKLAAIYHQFDSAVGGVAYGNEIDAIAVKKFGKHYQVMFKYANYWAQNFGVDTQKFWIQLTMDY